MKNKRGIEMDMLAWWLIGIAVLVLMVVGYFVLKDKGVNLIEMIKNAFRFRT
jgi:type VI protein secretion system component VasF